LFNCDKLSRVGEFLPKCRANHGGHSAANVIAFPLRKLGALGF
jgi:hypothetical protein